MLAEPDADVGIITKAVIFDDLPKDKTRRVKFQLTRMHRRWLRAQLRSGVPIIEFLFFDWEANPTGLYVLLY